MGFKLLSFISQTTPINNNKLSSMILPESINSNWKLSNSSSTIPTPVNLPTHIIMRIISFLDKDDIYSLAALSMASPTLKHLVAYFLTKHERIASSPQDRPTIRLHLNQANTWFDCVDFTAVGTSTLNGKCIFKPVSSTQTQTKTLQYPESTFYSSPVIASPILEKIVIGSVNVPFSSKTSSTFKLRPGYACFTISAGPKKFLKRSRSQDTEVSATIYYSIKATDGSKRRLTFSHIECDIGFLYYLPAKQDISIRNIVSDSDCAKNNTDLTREQLPSYCESLNHPIISFDTCPPYSSFIDLVKAKRYKTVRVKRM